MKKLSLLAFGALMVASILTSCKKDEEETLTFEEQLEGTWNLTNECEKCGTEAEECEAIPAGFATITFQDNVATIKAIFGVTETSTYTVAGNIVTMDGDPGLVTINNNTMTIITKEDSCTTTTTLTK